jgi:phytoene dehydrogenase-like protein
LIVPPDIENQLGLTEGDLQGGALTASQMLGYRPFSELGPDSTGSRTPVAGLYLAGPSSVLGPLATCASGVVAATAVAADLGAGRLG